MQSTNDISSELKRLLFNGLLNKDPAKRPSAKELLRAPIFREALDQYITRIQVVVERKLSSLCSKALAENEEYLLRHRPNSDNKSNNSNINHNKEDLIRKAEIEAAVKTAFRKKYVDWDWLQILQNHQKLITESDPSLSSQEVRAI